MIRDGRTTGHNTDATGFAESVRRGLPGAGMERVVLLGAGGAGSALAHALRRLGVEELVIVDADRERAAALARAVGGRVGRAERRRARRRARARDADRDGRPSRASRSTRASCTTGLWVADIVYRPLETELLRAARERGCRTLDGGGMVVFQAAGVARAVHRRAARPRADAAPLRGADGMRRSIATVCLSGTLEEKLEAAAAAGFDGVELFEPDLIASPLRPAEVRERARRARPDARPLPAVPRLRGACPSRTSRAPRRSSR